MDDFIFDLYAFFISHFSCPMVSKKYGCSFGLIFSASGDAQMDMVISTFCFGCQSDR